jgi:hypothetical protein
MTHKQAAELNAMKNTILVMADSLARLIETVNQLQKDVKTIREPLT